MLVIAGGIVLGVLGLRVISHPDFAWGAWLLVRVAFYLGVVGAFVIAVATGWTDAALVIAGVGAAPSILSAMVGSAGRAAVRPPKRRAHPVAVKLIAEGEFEGWTAEQLRAHAERCRREAKRLRAERLAR